MNKNEILLNMKHDTIIFSDQLRVNALEDDEFDQFTLNFEFDSDSKN